MLFPIPIPIRIRYPIRTLFAPLLLKLLFVHAWISLPHSNLACSLPFAFLPSAELSSSFSIEHVHVLALRLWFWFFYLSGFSWLLHAALTVWHLLCFSSVIFINKFACEMTLFMAFLYMKNACFHISQTRPGVFVFLSHVVDSFVKICLHAQISLRLSCNLFDIRFRFLSSVCLRLCVKSWHPKWIRNWVLSAVLCSFILILARFEFNIISLIRIYVTYVLAYV